MYARSSLFNSDHGYKVWGTLIIF